MVVSVQLAPPDFDRLFGALADHTRRDIVRRALSAEEGIVELASHYPMSFAAVQKHIAILERAGLVTKERIGRRKVVRTNVERLRVVRHLLDEYEKLWHRRIDRMAELIFEAKENDPCPSPPSAKIRTHTDADAAGRVRCVARAGMAAVGRSAPARALV